MQYTLEMADAVGGGCELLLRMVLLFIIFVKEVMEECATR
jgi:hypothetical protein